MICRKCGKELDQGAQFCRNCGNPVVDTDENKKDAYSKKAEGKEDVVSLKTEGIQKNNAGNETKKKPKNYKKLAIFGVACVVLILIICIFSEGEDDLSNNEKLEAVKLVNSSRTGAELDLSFEQAKKILGKKLQLGEYSSNFGWQKVNSLEGMDVYEAHSSLGVYAVQIGINSKTNNVINVSLYTTFDVFENDANMHSFCDTFKSMLNDEISEEEIQATFESIDTNNYGTNVDEGNGLLFYIENNVDEKWQQLGITAADVEYIKKSKNQQ